jgi:hypothetical protein
MDPRDVNRINYNNYFVGQNLDFLVRSKMRSESLSTPLKNTPAFYDDQVTSKMSLLGKRGFYDPGYIYGFNNPEDNDINDLQKNKNNEYTNPITREQYDQIILPKEHYREQMEQNYEMNNKNNNFNPNNKNYNNNMNEETYYKERNKQIERDRERERERMEMMRERQTPQKLDNFQLDRINKNQTNYENYENPNYINRNIINDNNINQQEIRNEYKPNYHYDPFYPKENMRIYDKYKSGMERNKDKIPNLNYAQQINDYNSINDIDKKNVGDLVLPPTKNEILQEVYLENFNKKHSPK